MIVLNNYRNKAFFVVFFLAFVAVVIVFFSLSGLVISDDGTENTVASGVVAGSYPVIVIDAGHGGEDGGAEANGAIEKNINLAIARSLHSYIDMSGFESVMTRDDDILLYNVGEENNKKRYDLINRVKIAEEFDNALFVSIHQNKFEISKYKGLQVYYSQNNNLSEKMAELIQNNAKLYLDSNNNRKIKAADFRIKVLDMLKIPAVLVECGFLSNSEEAALLSSHEYQNKIAFIIYLSLMEYIENNGE